MCCSKRRQLLVFLQSKQQLMAWPCELLTYAIHWFPDVMPHALLLDVTRSHTTIGY
jgi:hypothetical protein